jgi:hypothetical protein
MNFATGGFITGVRGGSFPQEKGCTEQFINSAHTDKMPGKPFLNQLIHWLT